MVCVGILAKNEDDIYLSIWVIKWAWVRGLMVKTFFLDYLTHQLRNDYVLLISRNLFQLCIAYLCAVESRLVVKIAVLGPLDNNWVTDLA